MQAALSSGSKVDSQGAKVACPMMGMAKSNQAKAKRKLEEVREKQKTVSTYSQSEVAGETSTSGCFCCTIKENKVKVNVNCHFTPLSMCSASSVKTRIMLC